MEVKRASEKTRFELKQAFGSYGFRRSRARIDSGALPGGAAGFVSYSNTHVGKWKGPGDSDRNNAMAGLALPAGKSLYIEVFSIYNNADGDNYRPLNYERASSPDLNYGYDYSRDPSDFHYYGYNKGDFEDINIFANIEYRIDPDSGVTVKPFYWKDSGFYRDTITRQDGSNRIRRWDIDHGLKGLLGQYSRRVHALYLNWKRGPLSPRTCRCTRRFRTTDSIFPRISTTRLGLPSPSTGTRCRMLPSIWSKLFSTIASGESAFFPSSGIPPAATGTFCSVKKSTAQPSSIWTSPIKRPSRKSGN